MSLPTTISGMDSLEVLEQNLRIASSFQIGREQHQFPTPQKLPA
jgi:hypothetical protein